LVPGQITEHDINTNIYQAENTVDINSADNFSVDISTPPPGFHRMVPGLFTENKNSVMQVFVSSHPTENATGDMYLDRMVPEQLTEENGVGGGCRFVSESGSAKQYQHTVQWMIFHHQTLGE
jgi:hypothetical protein